jgi:dynein heavy chain
MIDPQNQAYNWIKAREPDLEKRDFIFLITNPQLKERIRIPIEDGAACMIENVEEELDVLLDPLLEKQYVNKGRKKIIKLGDTEMDYIDSFRLYMTSRLGNPHFSPELAAKTTIIDFTVTQLGLEQQLLGRLISKEQKQLEDQQTALQEDVTNNTKVLANYEASLLSRLANSETDLLEDVELIDVLNEIKTKSKEVQEKLAEAKEKSIEIAEKREQFRPVASR